MTEYPLLADCDRVVCRTTHRSWPNMANQVGEPGNLGLHSGPARESALDRRRDLCRRMELNFDALTLGQQVHAAELAVVGPAQRGAGRASRAQAIAGVDGLLTAEPGTPLMVLSADCCPVVLVDPAHGAVAALHAGRKSTAGGIAGRAVAAMAAHFGSRPAELLAVVGPSIGPCCYEVGPEIAAEFPDRPELFVRVGGRWHLDLWRANRDQLHSVGVPPERIAVSQLCTACRHSDYYSYRREGPGCGLMGTLVAWRA